MHAYYFTVGTKYSRWPIQTETYWYALINICAGMCAMFFLSTCMKCVLCYLLIQPNFFAPSVTSACNWYMLYSHNYARHIILYQYCSYTRWICSSVVFTILLHVWLLLVWWWSPRKHFLGCVELLYFWTLNLSYSTFIVFITLLVISIGWQNKVFWS